MKTAGFEAARWWTLVSFVDVVSPISIAVSAAYGAFEFAKKKGLVKKTKKVAKTGEFETVQEGQLHTSLTACCYLYSGP